MKRTDAQSVGQIIDNFIQQEHLEGKFNEQKALQVWPQVVGQGINRYTVNRWVNNGVMTVQLSSAALRQELSMSRSTLIERINEAVGAQVITRLVFK